MSIRSASLLPLSRNDMERIPVLLVGIGGYGENYVREFLENDVPDAYLAGVADPFVYKSPYSKRLEELGIPTFQSPAEFYAKNKACLTVISSPIHTHYSYVMCALDNGSNVLVEKPVTIDLDKMDAMIRRQKESGLFVSVGYQLCYSRDVLALKKDILSGVYGRPLRMRSLRMMRRSSSYYARNGWAGRFSCHGEYVLDSPVSNACAHQIQNMLFLLGDDMGSTADVLSVSGKLYKGNPEIQNYDAAALRIATDKGVDLFYYTAHCLDEAKVGPVSTFEFERARIEEKDGVFTAFLNDGGTVDYGAVDKGLRLQKLYDSVSCCFSHEEPVCRLESALAHTKVVLMAQKLPCFLRFDAQKRTEGQEYYYAIDKLAEEYMGLYSSWSV